MLKLFVGFDERESAAIHTFVHSVMTRSSKPISFTFLARNQLSFTDPSQKEDYPQSNAFIFSRFLVPALCGFKGWALFCDGDMLCMDDISKLFELADETKAVQVVKHDYKTKYPVKYLGAKNEDYPKKNQSSVILFNCGHPANRTLTKEFVEASNGAYLHRFGWLDDDLIGSLPFEWNHLVLEQEPNTKASIVHWTCYGPYHNGYETVEYGEEFKSEYNAMTRCDQMLE